MSHKMSDKMQIRCGCKLMHIVCVDIIDRVQYALI